MREDILSEANARIENTIRSIKEVLKAEKGKNKKDSERSGKIQRIYNDRGDNR